MWCVFVCLPDVCMKRLSTWKSFEILFRSALNVASFFDMHACISEREMLNSQIDVWVLFEFLHEAMDSVGWSNLVGGLRKGFPFWKIWAASSNPTSSSFEDCFTFESGKRMYFSQTFHWWTCGARQTERRSYKIPWKLAKFRILIKSWFMEGIWGLLGARLCLGVHWHCQEWKAWWILKRFALSTDLISQNFMKIA